LSTPKIDRRLRVVRLFQDEQHSIRGARRVTMAISLAILFAIPLSGLVRMDLLAGRHVLLRREAPAVEVLPIILVVIAGLYLITFLLNWPFGRLFCGFGCPVGHVFRLEDRVDTSRTRAGRAGKGPILRSVAFTALLAGSLLIWWVDPAALLSATAGREVLIAAGALAGTTALLVWFGRSVRWTFCGKLCPIGIYYTAIQVAHRFGVQFDSELDTCIDCNLCDISCPVHLEPRHLEKRTNGAGGLAFDGFPGKNYCLECGDCVRVCAHIIRRRTGEEPPLRLTFRGR
jgi:polyferredoxin